MPQIPDSFYMPKIQDMTENGFNMEYMAGPTISGSISYSFPIHKPIIQDIKFTFKRDGDSIWVDSITKDEDEGFILGGAL